MSVPWMPSLTVREHGHRCRLQLAGDAWGTGETLQGAADDLVARVLQHAPALRGDGWAFGPELEAPDQRSGWSSSSTTWRHTHRNLRRSPPPRRAQRVVFGRDEKADSGLRRP